MRLGILLAFVVALTYPAGATCEELPSAVIEADGLKFTLNSSYVERLNFDPPSGTPIECLVVRFTLSTDDDARKYEFLGWREEKMRYAKLIDNKSNKYPQRAWSEKFAEGYSPAGYIAKVPAQIDKANPVKDVLVFPQPVAAADYLVLELDNKRCETTKPFKIVIKKPIAKPPEKK